MSAQLKMSSKGQVVVPKSMRRRFGWQDGARIEVIEEADRLTLLAEKRPGSLTSDEMIAALKALDTYQGPRISDEEMNASVADAVAEEYERSCNR